MYRWIVWIRIGGEWELVGDFPLAGDRVTPVMVAADMADMDSQCVLAWW